MHRALWLFLPALAWAGPIFPVTNLTCSYVNNGVTMSCTDIARVQQLPEVNGITGLKFWLDGFLRFLNPGGGEGTGSITFTTSGEVDEIPLSMTIPYAFDWSFFGEDDDIITGGEGDIITGSEGRVAICGSELPGALQACAVRVVGGSGGGVFVFPGPSDLNFAENFFSFKTTINFTYTGGGGLLRIPERSLDINPANTAVPEPSPAALVLGAGAILILARQRRAIKSAPHGSPLYFLARGDRPARRDASA